MNVSKNLTIMIQKNKKIVKMTVKEQTKQMIIYQLLMKSKKNLIHILADLQKIHNPLVKILQIL